MKKVINKEKVYFRPVKRMPTNIIGTVVDINQGLIVLTNNYENEIQINDEESEIKFSLCCLYVNDFTEINFRKINIDGAKVELNEFDKRNKTLYSAHYNSFPWKSIKIKDMKLNMTMLEFTAYLDDFRFEDYYEEKLSRKQIDSMIDLSVEIDLTFSNSKTKYAGKIELNGKIINKDNNKLNVAWIKHLCNSYFDHEISSTQF